MARSRPERDATGLADGAAAEPPLADPPVAGGGRRRQGDQTKRAIIQAAIDLYSENGFRGTGLMAIGERAGVAHATVLYHYGSSHALLMAVLAERERRFVEATASAWAEPGLGVLRHLPQVARFHVAEPELAKLFAILQAENLEPHHDANEFFRQRRTDVRELLKANLARAVSAGDARADLDVEAKADEILAFTTGAQIQYWLASDEFDLVELYERYTESLLRDLAP
jgi:AcrR family transcriptional regulator